MTAKDKFLVLYPLPNEIVVMTNCYLILGSLKRPYGIEQNVSFLALSNTLDHLGLQYLAVHLCIFIFSSQFLANLPDMWDRTLTVCSAGKTFSITGWKVSSIILTFVAFILDSRNFIIVLSLYDLE